MSSMQAIQCSAVQPADQDAGVCDNRLVDTGAACVACAVCTALTAACKLIGPELVSAVLPAVQGLCAHPRDLVRTCNHLAMVSLLNILSAFEHAMLSRNPGLASSHRSSPMHACMHVMRQVRKKAIMALHRFQQLDPGHEGQLSGADLDRFYRQALCDKVHPTTLWLAAEQLPRAG